MAELVVVRMLTRGPNRNYQLDQKVEVDAERAALLITGQHAELLVDDSEKEDANG